MRALVLWLMAVFVAVVVAACSSKQPCGAANCGTCCDANDECVKAVSDTACGSAGNTCAACGAGFSCMSGSCKRSGSGGGAGGGSGGSTGGGSGGATGGGSGGSGGSGTGGGATGGGSGGSGGSGTGGGAAITCPSGALPAAVQISFPPTCTVPTPCGGNPSGQFDYTGACIGQDEFQTFVTQVESVCGMGSVTVTGYDGGLQGDALFQNGQVCRRVQGSVTVSASIGGTFCPQFCSQVGSGISQAGYTGSCTQGTGVCNCTATRAINIVNQSAPYTTDATSLSIPSTGQRFETCLTGNVLTTRNTNAPDGGREPGVATLTKP